MWNRERRERGGKEKGIEREGRDRQRNERPGRKRGIERGRDINKEKKTEGVTIE